MIQATYIYEDDRGRPVFRKVRSTPKRFKMQAARYKDGRLFWKGEPGCLERWQPGWAPKALYHLPVLLDALRYGEPVFLVEGERDADVLSSLKKVPATTSHLGAKRFTEQQAEWFTRGRGGQVHIIRDNDDAGAYAAWERYTRLVAVGVSKRRIRLWVPTGAKDLAAAAAVGLQRTALTRERPEAVQRLAGAETARIAASRYTSQARCKNGERDRPSPPVPLLAKTRDGGVRPVEPSGGSL